MTFSTEKNKIFKLWNKAHSIQFLVRENKRKNEIILTRIDDLNRSNSVFETFQNLSTGWTKPKFSTFNTPGNPVDSQYVTFSLSVNGVSERFIPYFKSEIFFRVGDSKKSFPVPKSTNDNEFDFDILSNLNKNETVEIVKQGISIDITYRVSLYLERTISSGELPENLEFKIVSYLFNPNHYSD